MYKPSSKKSEAGYFFLAPWEKKKILMMNLSSSCEGWKDKNSGSGGTLTQKAPSRELCPFHGSIRFLVSFQILSFPLPSLVHAAVLTLGVLCRFLHPHLCDRGARRADQHRSSLPRRGQGFWALVNEDNLITHRWIGTRMELDPDQLRG